MKTNTRRKFIRNTSLTATGLFLTSITKATNESSVLAAVGCGPNQILSLLSTISSVKSGKWSDPATWGGKLPGNADKPVIAAGHTVVYDLDDTTIAGLNIASGATLKFEPSKSALLQSSKNIVVEGLLEMTPADHKVIHYIRFINIDESAVVGLGHMVLDTDTGLWVIGSGRLNLVGSPKKSWTNLLGTASAGSTSLTLKETPANWAAGDELVVCPTSGIDGLGRGRTIPLFERFTIKDVSGSTVNLNGSLVYEHAKVQPAGSDKQWTAEVLNLERNVKIEGTKGGKAHVFVKSAVPQTLKYVGLRHMGPKTANIGRYGIHFHHCMNGSIGSVVQDCVAYEIGSHSFVPHTSHGITFTNCVAFDFLQEAYWWDEGDVTHYTVYDGCVAALGAGTGFMLGMGDENVCNNCVAVGAAIGREGGSPNNSGAFFWEANNEGVWDFKNNLAHSNYNGLRVWQNTHKNHVIENYCSYNNMLAAFHGAYMNSYTYKFGYHYNSVFLGKATSSQTSGVRFEHVVFDAAGQDYAAIYSDSPIESWGEQTNKYYYCTFKNYKVAPIRFESAKLATTSGVTEEVVKIKKYDLVHCDLGSKLPFVHEYVENGTTIRIQPKSGQPIKIEKVGSLDMSNGKLVTSNIATFTSAVWGIGDGLTGDYYNGTINFEDSKKVVSRVDSIIAFNEWSTLNGGHPEMFHHKLTDDQYSVRWSGKLMAQYSEDYTFRCNSAGGIKLTVNGEVLIDKMDAEPFNINDRFALISSSIKLEAGKSYDIVLEHCNRGGYRGCILNWKSTSMTQYEIIPQSQMYPGNVTVPPPVKTEPENVAPVAKAGEDVTITLPTDTVKLDGQTSVDNDGKIASYKWSKISGPDTFAFDNAAAAVTNVSKLVAGDYIFRLEIKDDKGAVATDDVKVTVNAAVEEKTGSTIAKAGSDVTLKLPNNSVSLDGSGSTASAGEIVSYKWSKESGPSQYLLSNATSSKTTLSNLAVGTYVFKLAVEDSAGTTVSDTITITVNAEDTNQPPVAIAGDSVEVALPADDVKLNAFASTDPDGSITSFKWSKVKGPACKIENPLAASTKVSELAIGEYLFRLEVKDNKGALSTDDVAIKVNEKKPELQAPKVDAGSDIKIELPSNNVKLRGAARAFNGGSIKSFTWFKKSGPDRFKIVSPNSANTVVNQLVQGTYVFGLRITDSNGITATDEIVVSVVKKEAVADANTSINNKQTALNVSASPNPSTGVFRVSVNSNSSKPITLRLYDRWGKEVGQIKNVQSGTTVTIPNNLKKGTYFGTAEQGFQKKTITLIKM